MTVSSSTRFALTLWSAEADPYDRTQMQADHQTLDQLAVGFNEGTLALRPAPGRHGWLYLVTGGGASDGHLFYDTGAAWLDLTLVFGAVGDITASGFGDAGAAGATGKVADAGHRHPREANPVTAHVGLADPHPQYAVDTDVAAVAASVAAHEAAWTAFAPVVKAGGVAYVFAAGVAKGAYKLIGKTLHFNISVTAAPTSGGAAGAVTVDLPAGVTTVARRQTVPASIAMASPPAGFGSFQESNQMILESATSMQFNIFENGGTGVGILAGGNNPNLIIVSGTLEVV